MISGTFASSPSNVQAPNRSVSSPVTWCPRSSSIGVSTLPI
jgi:hypothetical protein